jgi:hypothetical protein
MSLYSAEAWFFLKTSEKLGSGLLEWLLNAVPKPDKGI